MVWLLCGGAIVGLSYTDAVLVMGGRNSRTVAVLDRLTGGLLLVASAAGAGFALSLFEPRSELALLSDELVRDLGERIRGLDRFTRSERVAAAHSVVVLSAYFDVLAGAELRLTPKSLSSRRLSRWRWQGERRRDLTGFGHWLTSYCGLRCRCPYGSGRMKPHLRRCGAFTGTCPLTCRGSCLGWRCGTDLTRRAGIGLQWRCPMNCRPGRARYEERFRQLAVEFPEIAFWANLLDHQATREQVRRLGTGMAGLERMLAGIAAGRVPDDRRLGLSRAYQAVLERPVLPSRRRPGRISSSFAW